MANQRGIRSAGARALIVPEPAPPERVELEITPREKSVESFVMTRAAERSWEIVNRTIGAPQGAMYWIVGPPGSGKTHFLNFVLALENRAATPAAEPGRHLVCGIELAGRIPSNEISSYLLEALAEQIGADRESASLWRDLKGVEAITLAMEHVRRIGVRALTIAIDFSASNAEIEADYFGALANLARTTRIMRLTVIGASRGPAPAGAIALAVAPGNPAEVMRVAIARARTLAQGVDETIREFYAGINLRGFDPVEIYPFEPLAIRAIGVLADPPGTVAAAARFAREAIVSELDIGWSGRLIYCADLMESAVLARRVEAGLGEAGRAAFKVAVNALEAFHGNEKILARELLNALVIESALDAAKPVPLTELDSRVPMLSAGSPGSANALALADVLRRLEARTSGAVHITESGEAVFDPAAALSLSATRFNAALALTRQFEPSLEPARDDASVSAGVAALGDAMTSAVENAARTRRTLEAALAQANLAIPSAQANTIEAYVELAESGAERLLEIGADPVRRDVALKVVSHYRELEAAAEVAPRMRAMREFVEATGLRIPSEEEPAQDPRVATLETECHLLLAELAPRVLAGAPRGLDALEARFQKFKWTYVALYRSLHNAWKLEMERAAFILDDARRRLQALERLDAIEMLGPPLASGFMPNLEGLARRVARCDHNAARHLEVVPRCAQCRYMLGSISPRAELDELVSRLDRALAAKLEALSQSAISRLIREHDRAHRLDGFLKIIQAAQIDALARVLDDKLARYLARLLDENLGAAANAGAVTSIARHTAPGSPGLRAARRRTPS